MGLAAALAASAVVFSGVKLAGASFLVALGMRSLWAAIRTRDVLGEVSQPGATDNLGAFVQGLVGNLLNPKAAAIFVAVVPQFIDHADPPSRLAEMIGAFVVMVVIWLNAYGFLVAKAAKHFGPRIWRVLEGLAGALLVGIGALLVVERR